MKCVYELENSYVSYTLSGAAAKSKEMNEKALGIT